MSALALTVNALNTIEATSSEVSRRLKSGSLLREFMREIFVVFTLGYHLKRQLALQRRFIDDIRVADVNSLPDYQLADMGSRVQRLVCINDEILAAAPYLPAYWQRYFRSMADQQNELDSIAETFSMSANPAARGQIDLLISEPVDGTVDEDWREFVGSLRD